MKTTDISTDRDLLAQILSAAEGLGLAASWDVAAPSILPVLRRAWHPFPPEAAPLHLHVPPGIWTGFGIDLGPAFSHVTATMVDAWRVDPATLLVTALDNLSRLVASEPPRVEPVDFEGTRLVLVQGHGWGSALLLLPEALARILGSEPRLLMAPVRNTLVALPDDVAVDTATRVWDALADGAHDELDVDPLGWTGTTVIALGRGDRGLPN